MKLQIDRERLVQELDALGAISQEPAPVVTRVIFTEADVRGREFVKSLCREAGLTVREDAVGNTFARWSGENPEREDAGDRNLPIAERAHPGDVIGIETGGERTYVGDTKENEEARRDAAVDTVRHSRH